MAATKLEKAIAAVLLVGVPVGLIAGLLLTKRSTQTASGWSNEETVQIKRDGAGFIEEMTVHRELHDR